MPSKHGQKAIIFARSQKSFSVLAKINPWKISFIGRSRKLIHANIFEVTVCENLSTQKLIIVRYLFSYQFLSLFFISYIFFHIVKICHGFNFGDGLFRVVYGNITIFTFRATTVVVFHFQQHG